jgi:hypothetical protein
LRFVCRAHQLAQKEGKKPFTENFRSLEISGNRTRGALASGNFGLGKKKTCFGSPNAQIPTAPPLVCGHPFRKRQKGRKIHLAVNNFIPANQRRRFLD